MRVIGIIAEFNPFHNGHARLLSYAKKELGADYVVAVMSGDYVQRGAPACIGRHARAKAALLSGVDAVFSLPVGISTASAEGFAEGGVRALLGLGCVDTLLFGSESGNLERLLACARALSFEEAFRLLTEDHALAGKSPSSKTLRAALKSGASYPKARAAAFPEFADLLENPNNILAIEYLKALEKTGGRMTPATLRRNGEYHGVFEGGGVPSAEAIRYKVREILKDSASDEAAAKREHLEKGWEKEKTELGRLARKTMPMSAAEVFLKEVEENGLTTAEDFSLLLGERLFSALQYEEFLPYAGVSEDLGRRIFEKRGAFTSFAAFSSLVKTRNLTYTAVSRALLSILLGIPKDGQSAVPYLRVLGYRRTSSPLLREIAAKGTLPVLFRYKEAEDLVGRYAPPGSVETQIPVGQNALPYPVEAEIPVGQNALFESAGTAKKERDRSFLAAHLRREITAANLYALVRAQKAGRLPLSENNLPVCIL